MSLLTLAKRAEVIAHLCEGAGIRPTSRLSDVSKPTILALLLKVGEGCNRLHDRFVRNLDIRDIQADEIWSFIQKKQARVTAEDDPTHGDAYTFLAIARSQKLIVSYLVGKRDDASTQAFVADLRARLLVAPQLSTDGFASYKSAVGEHFEAVDYGQVVKNYSRSPRRVRDGQASDHRYEPPRDPFAVRTPVFGTPDLAKLCTSHVERLNLEVRMSTRRLTRLCNGFSRTAKHMRAAISVFVAHHNWCKVHSALRVTPAMEAGITDRVWDTEELVHHALAALEVPAVPLVKQPLRLPEVAPSVPEAPVRALPNGRGFLRLVAGSGVAPAPRAPTPEPSPAAPAESPRETGATGGPAQLDLLAWRPKAAPEAWEQLPLFGDEAPH